MKYLAGFLCALALATSACAESILGGLEEFSATLNQLNDDVLRRHLSFENQMRLYRREEAAKVREFSVVSGVSESVIRKMRRDGATWNQIAAKYGVNLDSLPLPPAGE